MAFAIAAVVVLTLITIILEYELVEHVYDFTRAHEDWDLDEYLLFILWSGLVAIIYSIRRVYEIKRLNKSIAEYAYIDSITKLPNRKLGLDLLDSKVKKSRTKSTSFSVLFLDFNNFKHINDTFGHAAGDQLLKLVSERLNKLVGEQGPICRFGGDEFFIIFNAKSGTNEIDDIIKKIIDSSKTPFNIDQSTIFMYFSIGLATYPDDGKTSRELLMHADAAMYSAKGKKTTYVQKYNIEISNRIELAHSIQHTLISGEFEHEFYLEYQPQINTEDGSIFAFEALLRWSHQGRLLCPTEFIPVAEDNGLIHTIGNWVLKTSMLEFKRWNTVNIKLSVNISSLEFLRETFVDDLKSIIHITDFPPEKLELEITETSLIADLQLVKEKLNQIREMNITVAIDDFGMGYSSLSRLRDLEFDKLKIDKSFIDDINTHAKLEKILSIIVSLAKLLNACVVAEGVETETQIQSLKALGCHNMQGFYFSKPIASENAQELAKHNTLNPFQTNQTANSPSIRLHK